MNSKHNKKVNSIVNQEAAVLGMGSSGDLLVAGWAGEVGTGSTQVLEGDQCEVG